MWETLQDRRRTCRQRARARLTLVKTCAAGRAYVWVAPFAVGGAYLPPELDSPEEAGRILAQRRRAGAGLDPRDHAGPGD